MALLLASPTELQAITTLQEAADFMALDNLARDALIAQLGLGLSLKILATTQIATLRSAILSARVPIPAQGTVPETDRRLTLVEVAQVGLTWRVARQVYGLADVDPLDVTIGVAVNPALLHLQREAHGFSSSTA